MKWCATLPERIDTNATGGGCLQRDAGFPVNVDHAHAGVESEFCFNCGIRLTGPYCAACGQKALPLDVSVHHFTHDLIHETLHVDGRIFKSIQRLLLSPGFLTREYLQGRRARWISAFRLYIIFSFVFFALGALAPARDVRLTVSPEDKQEVAAALQEMGYKDTNELRSALSAGLLKWVPRAMFVLMPVFAWFVALAYWRADPNYLHHLYFALHVHAAWFALAAIAAATAIVSSRAGGVVVSVGIIYALVYVVIAVHVTYGGTVATAVKRAAAVMSVYAFTVLLALSAIIGPLLIGRR